MGIKRILVPIDGTERSMHSLDFIREMYAPNQVKLDIINVKELVFIDGISMSDEIKNSEKFGKELLEKSRKFMEGYDVDLYFTFGYAGDEIVKKADEDKSDLIIMTRSTKKGITRMVGSCTSYVLKHAKCAITVIPE